MPATSLGIAIPNGRHAREKVGAMPNCRYQEEGGNDELDVA
jgi:hypothetical protein